MRLFLLLTATCDLALAGSSCVPTTSGSYGFRLVVNVTDPSRDLSPSINNLYLNLAHIGPAQNRAIAGPTPGPIFYQNGTSSMSGLSFTTLLTDGGTPPFPEGLTYAQERTDAKGSGIYVSAGSGAQAVKLTRLSNPYSYLTILSEVIGSSFIGCNSTIPYYGEERQFQVINWVTTTRNATGTHLVIPEGCVPLNLVPECAVLEALPPDAKSSHEWAQEVRCYEDVKGVSGWGTVGY
ncbi:hypothetical protein B0T16DRAFT_420932 [Cercophora newfieldiana]|uniref:DUF7907 domain-containing protein n=1 Tax=Cercophora newfieldiana TaxID=92897 RepID=A0AA40CKS1_9PEZI|nr:hypothetical protein B0T16DRAFT_420932 [Cercophora newfieldiana]